MKGTGMALAVVFYLISLFLFVNSARCGTNKWYKPIARYGTYEWYVPNHLQMGKSAKADIDESE